MYVRVICRLGGYIACVNEMSHLAENCENKGDRRLRNERCLRIFTSF